MKKEFMRLLSGIGAAVIALSAYPVCSAAATVRESDGISVVVDGERLSFEQEPVIENDRVLVPLRAIFEALGCEVSYSEYDDTIYASHGLTAVYTEIGSDVLIYYDETEKAKEITLDTPSKRVGDTTLVPVRAISETLNALVAWDAETRTVEIFSGLLNEHKTNGIKLNNVIKDETGRELVVFNAVYPEIENAENDEFIAEQNKKYKTYAEERMEESKAWVEDAEAILKTEREYGSSPSLPLSCSISFDISRDSDDILSITLIESMYTGGAHPMSSRTSNTYDLKNKKELTLSEVLTGKEEEIGKTVVAAFADKAAEASEGDFEATEAFMPAIEAEKNNVNWLLTEDGLVLYFGLYQVAPYAAGYPSVKIYYESNAELFKDGIMPKAKSIGIIGGADGPTAIYVTGK